MSHSPPHIFRLQSGGLIVNLKCTSACRHCLYGCSGKWPDDYADAAATRANLTVIKKLGCHCVHIGGGEPFLHPEKLFTVLEAARDAGVSIDYIETNSSWVKDEPWTDEVLRGVRDRGVSCLLLSMDPFHNEYIPFIKVKKLMGACRRTGLDIFPWRAEFAEELQRLNIHRTHKLEACEKTFGSDYIRDLVNRYRPTERGRPLTLVRPFRRHAPVDDVLEQNDAPCRELDSTSHFHIDLYGNYLPGLCSGLSIHIDDLGKPVSEEKYPFLSALYSRGIKGLYELAVRTVAFQARPEGYMSKCDLCFHIRKYLVTENDVTSPDLQPAGYYTFS